MQQNPSYFSVRTRTVERVGEETEGNFLSSVCVEAEEGRLEDGMELGAEARQEEVSKVREWCDST